MRKTLASLLFFFLSVTTAKSQSDTIFLMNGHVVPATITDTSEAIIRALRIGSSGRPLLYSPDQLYKIHFSNGNELYYYSQSAALNNWLSRPDMWLYIKGEQDARKGYKARGAMIGALLTGIAGGMTGTFWGPLAPYGFMLLTGLPKIRIRHKTVSDLALLNSEAYLMGYERVARQKGKLVALGAGTVGLVTGYALYFSLHQFYPETLNLSLLR